MTTQARDDAAVKCEQLWRIESAKAAGENPPDYRSLLRRWQSHEARCGATVAYEARLATAHLLVGEVEKARAILKRVRGRDSTYQHLVELAEIVADQVEMLRAPLTTADDVRRLESRLQQLVRKHPDFSEAHGMLGGMQSMLGEHADAVVSLERGLRSPMNPAGVYRHLTISLAALGRHQDALRAADEAVNHDRALTSDQYFMFALSIANAGIGNVQDAEMILQVILAKKPDVRGDPEFRKALEFLQARKSAPPAGRPQR